MSEQSNYVRQSRGVALEIADLGAHAGDVNSMALAVDGANRIVGRTVDALGRDRAVTWDVSGAPPVLREFALTGAPGTCVMAASPGGRVGGWGANNAKMVAAVWDVRSTTLTRVEYLFTAASAPVYTEVVGMSNSGAVVGFKQDAAAHLAFVGLPIMP